MGYDHYTQKVGWNLQTLLRPRVSKIIFEMFRYNPKLLGIWRTRKISTSIERGDQKMVQLRMDRCWNYETKTLSQLLKKCSKKSEHAWKEWKESFCKFSLANGSYKLEQGNFRTNNKVIKFFKSLNGLNSKWRWKRKDQWTWW